MKEIDINSKINKLKQNIKEFNTKKKELYEYILKNKNKYQESADTDYEKSKLISDNYMEMKEKIIELNNFNINDKIDELKSLIDNNVIKNNTKPINYQIIQDEKNKYDNLPIDTKYKTISKNDNIKLEYNNEIAIYKINRHILKDIIAFNFLISYSQENKNSIIEKYYKGTLIVNNITSNPNVKGYIIIPDNEIDGFENASIGPEFEINFKCNEDYIYIIFTHTKIFRFDIDNDNNFIDIFSTQYSKKEISYKIDLAFYSADESTNIETIEQIDTECFDIKNSKIILKPIEEGFYKYINFSSNNKNISFKNKEKKYIFNSHILDKNEYNKKIKYFDINKMNDYIKTEYEKNIEKFLSLIEYNNEFHLNINDVYCDKEKIIFATNKGLYGYLYNENTFFNISKNWISVYDSKIINEDYMCIGKYDDRYYTYTKESGLISFNSNIFDYVVNGTIPNDIKTVPFNNVLEAVKNSNTNPMSNITEIKIDNGLLFLNNSNQKENECFCKIIDFSLNEKNSFNASTNNDDKKIILFDKNKNFFNISLNKICGFLKNKNIIFLKNENKISVIDNFDIDKNDHSIIYDDEYILNIDFNKYNFNIDSSFIFVEENNKIYCIFENNDKQIASLEIKKIENEYQIIDNLDIITDKSIFQSIDKIKYFDENIFIFNNISFLYINENKIIKNETISSIREKINKILYNKFDESKQDNKILYNLKIYAKKDIDSDNKYDSLYKEIGVINRVVDKDYEIARTEFGTFLKEKDQDDIYYWANNKDNCEKNGNEKDRYENIRFERITKKQMLGIKKVYVFTNKDDFNNDYNIKLAADIPTENKYKHGNKTTTPFYNNEHGIKFVSIKKKCTTMSFYYETYGGANGHIYLYIDGIYKGFWWNNSVQSWPQVSIINLPDEEHEFTWVLVDVGGTPCIDTISFNNELVTDINEFNNEYKISLANIVTEDTYKNGNETIAPFYNKDSIKFVSIKKKCISMSFWYKAYENNSINIHVYLYIDGIFKDYYRSSSWNQAFITDLTDEEHEFTWILTENSCIDTIKFMIDIDINNYSFIWNDIDKNINGEFDGLVTNLLYSSFPVEIEYKKNINNVKKIFTNINKTLVLNENDLFVSYDRILNPINKEKILRNGVFNLTNFKDRSTYLNKVDIKLNISDIKDIKLTDCCIFILTKNDKLYMCGNNILNEIPNCKQNLIVHDIIKIFENVSNIWVSNLMNIIEIEKDGKKEYHLSGLNSFIEEKEIKTFFNNYIDNDISNIKNIKDIKIFDKNIFIITYDNKVYVRGENNHVGSIDKKKIIDSYELVFSDKNIKNIIDIKMNKYFTLIHCIDNEDKNVYYYSGTIDNNKSDKFEMINFNNEMCNTKDVFIFDSSEYITYFVDQNEVMYISSSINENNKYKINHFIEKILKVNDNFYLLMNSCIYIYEPLNNQLTKVIDKVYDFFSFDNSILRIIRTDMTYGTIFLDNYSFAKEYNYGSGVYIGPNIERKNIRKIKYEIESDYMEAYYGFNYNENKNEIISYILDLNNNRNKKKISDFKESSDIFGIKKIRKTNMIMDNLESLDSNENSKMYSVIFEILPINPDLIDNIVDVKDIDDESDTKIQSILR